MHIVTDKYKELHWKDDGFDKPWLGHKFGKGNKMAHEMRCIICGKWISYNDEQINGFILEGRWDFEKNRLMHCNNSTCQDYYQEMKKDLARTIRMNSWELYDDLRKRSLIL